MGNKIGISLAEALGENRSVQSLYLYVDTCSQRLLLALLDALRSNNRLESLTLEVGGTIPVSEEVCLAASATLEQNLCLQTLNFTMGLSVDDEEVVCLGKGIAAALKRNQQAFSVARTLGRLARQRDGRFGTLADG